MAQLLSISTIIYNLIAMMIFIWRDPSYIKLTEQYLISTFIALRDDIFEGPVYQSLDYQVPVKHLFKGYEFEEQYIVSQGYTLKLYHIMNKGQKATDPDLEPVFFMHGLMDQGSSWVIAEREHSVVFKMLEEKKYDIWIANSRESIQTSTHEKYSDMQEEFWNFTFYEMANYDIPAFVDHVLEKTGKNKLTYIGHSQGTLTFFLASVFHERDFTSKIRTFIGLAPVLSTAHAHNGLSVLIDGLSMIDWINEDTEHFTRFSPTLKNIILPWVSQYLPRTIMNQVQSIIGLNQKNHVPLDRLGVVCRYSFGGVSTKNLFHFQQMRQKGELRLYDYQDYQTNIDHYGLPDPPVIPLNKLTKALEQVNVLLVSGEVDNLVSKPDFEFTKQFMPASTRYESVTDYNHMDLLWASDAYIELHPLMLNFIHEKVKQ